MEINRITDQRLTELKACDCCDGTNFDAFTELEPPLNGIVRCCGCNLQMRRPTLDEAIAAWNKSVVRGVCGEAYQLAGAVGAPVKALDNLSYAAQGAPLPHKTFLPITDTDFRNERPGDAVTLAAHVKDLITAVTDWLKWHDIGLKNRASAISTYESGAIPRAVARAGAARLRIYLHADRERIAGNDRVVGSPGNDSREIKTTAESLTVKPAPEPEKEWSVLFDVPDITDAYTSIGTRDGAEFIHRCILAQPGTRTNIRLVSRAKSVVIPAGPWDVETVG